MEHNVHATDVIELLRGIHQCLRRPLILVCDRWQVHRSAVKQLEASRSPWLYVEWLPPYAPELDPVEYVWNQVKYCDLANFIPEDLAELHYQVDRMLTEYSHDPDRLHSFFDAAGLGI
jgi:transposase